MNSRILERDIRGADLLEQAARRVHVQDELVHVLELRFGGSDHQVGAFGHHGEVVIGDQGGDLHDDVAPRVESGHLQIHPYQHGMHATG